jgi:hypothetical protein
MKKSEQLGTQTEPDSDSSQGSARTNTASNPQLEQILARLVENQSKPQYIRNTEVIKKFPDTDPDYKFSRFRFLFSKYVHERKYSEAGCFSKFIKLLGGGALTFALSLQLEEKKGTAPQYSMDQWFQKFEKEYSDEAASRNRTKSVMPKSGVQVTIPEYTAILFADILMLWNVLPRWNVCSC